MDDDDAFDFNATVCTPIDDEIVIAASGDEGARIWRSSRMAALALIACLAMAVSETLGSPRNSDG